MCDQVLNDDGICISESLGRCKGGCAADFFSGLKEHGFSGLKITDKGIEEF